ncbi:hypothetical protein DYB28_015927 [Aphanomyces astaci]|uniref:Uncharacterized protein n=1 Tax=Aphanomyces astaci TaxID=112090 RepID=A0A9X8E8Q5_APHAT|nr:hypothetical protein DYB28_015927 [Aphanomyces astaci]
MEQLRRHLHAAVADVVRESSRGHTAAAKQALERRNQLKRQMKHLHDCSLGGARPRGSNERSSLREDLRASQVELAALRSKHPGDGVPAFSTASIAKLNPHDIAALQAKLDGLLSTSTSTVSDESLDDNNKRGGYGQTSPAQDKWRRHGHSNHHRMEDPTLSKSKHSCMNDNDAADMPVDRLRLSDIQIFTASNKRVDMKDLNQLDDIHSFSL